MQNRNAAPLPSNPSVSTMEAGSQTTSGEPTSNCVGKAPSLVYRAEDIARMLDISLRAAYNLCNTNTQFKVIHIGTSIRVSKASFDSWLANGQ